jgi:hypothetical protein
MIFPPSMLLGSIGYPGILEGYWNSGQARKEWLGRQICGPGAGSGSLEAGSEQ